MHALRLAPNEVAEHLGTASVASGDLRQARGTCLPAWAATYLADLRAPAVWAGLAAFLTYAFGVLPVQLAVTARLGLAPDQAASWIAAVWLSGAAASIGLSLWLRQPIPVSSSTPAVLFLGAQAAAFGYPELVGACLAAGVLVILLGVSGLGGRLLAWLPLPIAMGMFAGSLLGDVSHMATGLAQDLPVAGPTILAYLVGRALRLQRIPPLGLAVVVGAAVVVVRGAAWPALEVAPPTLVLAPMRLDPSALLGVALPLVILSAVLGNVQGLGYLRAQGYPVPVGRVTVVVGLASVVNALAGGHSALISRTTTPLVGGAEAGPARCRYWAAVVSGLLVLVFVLAAGPLVRLITVLPAGYTMAVTGLALLPAFQNALEVTTANTCRTGGIVAFVVAASPVSALGLPAAAWALVAGLLVSGCLEHADLLATWRASETPARPRDANGAACQSASAPGRDAPLPAPTPV